MKPLHLNFPVHLVVALIMASTLLTPNPAGSQTMSSASLPLIPAPQSWQPAGGHFLKNSLQSVLAGEVDPELAALVAEQLGLPVASNPESNQLVLSPIGEAWSLTADEEISAPGAADESYRLEIHSNRLEISAFSRSGLFRGVQTLRQLLAAEEPTLACGLIEDEPAFGWRGMLLDCGRHFMPLEVIKETLDQLAYHKFNVLHWHLTEDQGWRLEVPGYPLLTEVGAWRKEPDGTLYGGFYTEADVREIVAYAAERYITVVPEIELPGHSVAALAAYPELSCQGKTLTVETQWGIFKDVYCAGNEQVFTFFGDVFDHVLKLFPSRYIHIGGDESPKDRWMVCPKCQKRIADEGLAGEHELQSWFIQRIEKYLIARDRRLIGWDEILEGGLAPEATVQSWRGTRGAIAAARQGHDAIVSPTSHCYFDYDVATLDLRQVYSFDPVPEKLSAKESEHILGGEMNLWSEYIPPERLNNMLFPRMTAMAECLWTRPDNRDFGTYLDRLWPHLKQLQEMGVKVGPADRPIKLAASLDPETGASVVDLTLDEKLEKALKGRDLEMRSRSFSRQELANYRPDLRTEDMGLPEVRLSDPLATGPMKWQANDPKDEMLALQLFIDGAPYGTPAILERAGHLAVGLTPDLVHAPSSRYPGGGPLGLCNGLHGSRDFRDGLWSGFEGNDLDARLDLGQPRKLSRLSIRFYQGATAWVFLPRDVLFQISDDGTSWKTVGTVSHDVSPAIQDRTIHEFVVDGLELEARFVRIVGRSLGTCPDWHPGSGRACWVFADEIVIR